VNYHLGVDGISVWFVLLTAFITIIVVIAGWEVITERVAPVHGRVPDPVRPDERRVRRARRLLFYVFFEATLIPMYIIIGVWGGPARLRGLQVLPVHAARLAADAGGADLPVLQVGRQLRHPDWHKLPLPMRGAGAGCSSPSCWPSR
jgi:NADH-quinone oxidoreductase subunit M